VRALAPFLCAWNLERFCAPGGCTLHAFFIVFDGFAFQAPTPGQVGEPTQTDAKTFGAGISVVLSGQVTAQSGDEFIGLA